MFVLKLQYIPSVTIDPRMYKVTWVGLSISSRKPKLPPIEYSRKVDMENYTLSLRLSLLLTKYLVDARSFEFRNDLFTKYLTNPHIFFDLFFSNIYHRVIQIGIWCTTSELKKLEGVYRILFNNRALLLFFRDSFRDYLLSCDYLTDKERVDLLECYDEITTILPDLDLFLDNPSPREDIILIIKGRIDHIRANIRL